MATDDGFLARWSRRKTETLRGAPPPEPPPPEAAPVLAAAPAIAAPQAAPQAAAPPEPAAEAPDPPPTLADVERLTPAADFSRFVKADVDAGVKNAALKKLFADPHYNVMDGLDIYIGDYNTPDPLPKSMLRQMVQSRLLGLFDDEPEAGVAATPPASAAPSDPPAPPAETLPDEDPDLRLQPDDAAGRAEPRAGAGEDERREP